MNSRHLGSSMLVLVGAVLLAPLSSAQGGLMGKAARELAEQIAAKLGKSAVREGTEALAGRIAKAAAKHGDDLVAAVRKVGPKAMDLADEAGANAPRLLRFLTRHGDDGLEVLGKSKGIELFTRFGDDAAEVLIRHKVVAASVIEHVGEPGIKALGAIGPQAGRRMAMMAGELASSPHRVEIMGVIARYGDPAMEFIWKHKAVLASGATLAAFIANPEPFISGTTQLAAVVGENVTKPAIVAVGNVAQEAASFVRWTLTFLLLGILAGVGLAFRQGVFEKPPVRFALRTAGDYIGKRFLSGVFKGKH